MKENKKCLHIALRSQIWFFAYVPTSDGVANLCSLRGRLKRV